MESLFTDKSNVNRDKFQMQTNTETETDMEYGVAMTSRLLKIVRLLCKRAL